MVSKIFPSFLFSAKIQDGRQKLRKLKFFSFGQDTLLLPYGSKIRLQSLYLLQFPRYFQFFIFLLKSKMAAQSGEN